MLRFALRGCAAASAAALTLIATPVTAAHAPHGFARPVFEACPEVSCKSKEELAAMFADHAPRPAARRIATSTPASTAPQPAGSGSADGARHSSGAAAASAASAVLPASANTLPCPPAREELGMHSWHLLHTMAAYYPEHPADEDRTAAAGLVAALTRLYPCTHCRARLQGEVERNPPRYNSRADFSLWMCEQHNAVNSELGKPTFPCSLQALDERWRTGRPECWIAAPQSAQESLGQTDDDDTDTP